MGGGGRTEEVVEGMVEPVICHKMSLGMNAADDFGILFNEVAQAEERGLGAVCRENIEGPRGVFRMRAVIEGERDTVLRSIPVDKGGIED